MLYSFVMDDPLLQLRSWLGSGSINLFGPQFSGKDTQAKRLANALHGAVIGGGDIIRGSTFTPAVTAMMNRGELLPTELYVDTVRPFFENPDYASKPLILSAVGRWIGEEQGVIAVCQQTNHPILAVIELALPDDHAIERWKMLKHDDTRGIREDDNEAALLRRLELYREKTLPVLEIYRSMGLLITVDGTQSPEDVTSALISSLLTFSLVSASP